MFGAPVDLKPRGPFIGVSKIEVVQNKVVRGTVGWEGVGGLFSLGKPWMLGNHFLR